MSAVYQSQRTASGLAVWDYQQPYATGASATAAEIWAYEIEPGLSAGSILRLMAAVLLGKVSGAGSGIETFRDVNDTVNRVVSTVDAVGNRVRVTLNGD